MWEYFSVQTTLFTLWGYSMSYIEFVGTVFSLWCVWLAVKNHIWNWPVGILGIIAFGALFWQVGLYSDFFAQIYFFITNVWGWWLWLRPRDDKDKAIGERRIITVSNRTRLVYILSIGVGTILLGALTKALPQLLPIFFPTPAAFPYIDAFIAMMSFAATILMARRELECWYLWIAVDVISTCLYWTKGIKLVAVLYLVFLVLATKGLLYWITLWRRTEAQIV